MCATLKSDDAFLADFEADRLDPEGFDHRAHIKAGFLLLERTDFLDAAQRYGRALRQLAARAGAPQKFNVTITLAFLALIAERMEGWSEADAFIDAHPALMDTRVLAPWYPDLEAIRNRGRETLLMPATK